MLRVVHSVETGLSPAPALPSRHQPDARLLADFLEAAGCGSASEGIAERLLRETGSLAAALAAPAADFVRLGIPQSAARALRLLRSMMTASLRRQVEDRPCLASSQAVLDYLHIEMAHRSTESFRVLFLNTQNILIRDETMSEGTVHTAPVFTREVIRRALELGASALILVHNHTSGNPKPSRDDIEITREIKTAASFLDIAVHDHIVIGRQGHVSLGQLGHLG